MARLETRTFGSKKQLLVIAETEEERLMIEKMLKSKSKTRDLVEGELLSNDAFEPYLRLIKKGQTA
jgi:hypothetical protein